MSSQAPNPNLAKLASCAARLQPLLDKIAFVGGCVTGLQITDPASAPVRPTLDVDVIVGVTSYAEFTALEQQLRQLGFRETQAQGAPVCRWMHGDLLLDFMPVDSAILGFTNRWYRAALQNAQAIKIANYEVRVITAPYFIATKLEAFHGRGKNDFRSSHDLEDIVAVIDGRSELAAEVHLAADDLQKYLSEEFSALLSNRSFLDALPGHLLPDAASQQRAGLILARMKKMTLQG
jgi:predicted nucleotidyltransferase